MNGPRHPGMILVGVIGLALLALTPAAVAAPGVARERTHRVVPGETLWTIAQRDLGSTAAWHLLYQLNRKAIGPDPRVLHAGTVLVIRQAPRVRPGPPDAAMHTTGRSARTLQRRGATSAAPVPGKPEPASTPGRDPFEFKTAP